MSLNPPAVPRTLIVDISSGYGGITSRETMIAGHMPPGSVGLACLRGSEAEKAARQVNCRVHTVGRSKFDPMIPCRLRACVREHGYRVLDPQNAVSKLWSSIAVRGEQVALVSTVNSLSREEHGGSMKGKLYEALERHTNTNLDLYITVSSGDRRRIMEWGIPADTIGLIPNAVSVPPECAAFGKPDLLRELGLPESSMVCVAAGRFVWQKGYPELVEAFRLIARRVPELHCALMGSGGETEAQVRQAVSRYGLGGRIRMLGHVPRERALRFIHASDFFVMPSRYEGTPVALLEAAALGTPIAATRGGGIPDLVEDKLHALLSPPFDFEAFAESMATLARDREYARGLAVRARDHVKRSFSPESLAAATARAYAKAWRRAQGRLYPRAPSGVTGVMAP